MTDEVHYHDDSVVCDCMPEISAKDRTTQAYSDTVAYYMNTSGFSVDAMLMLMSGGKPTPLMQKVSSNVEKLKAMMAELDSSGVYPAEWQESPSWLKLIGEA